MEMYVPLYQRPQFLLFLFFSLLCTALISAAIFRIFRQKLGFGREGAYLLSVATVLSALGWGLYHYRPTEAALLIALCKALLILFGVPLAVKLYRAWLAGSCTDQERLPGIEGVRAWLSPFNLLLALVLSICATKAQGYPFLGTFALLILALLVYPVANMVTNQPASSEPPRQPLRAEREKVLSLLEAGKITAEESAELLNALGAEPSPREPRTTPRQQRLALIGAALVLIGFFLPWFSINPGKELNNFAAPMINQINALQQRMPGMPDIREGMQIQTATLYLAGGDLSHGLGWLVLLMGIAVAILPTVAPEMDRATHRMASLLTLSTGSVVLVYLLTQNLRFLSAGIFIATAGYSLLWMSLGGTGAAKASSGAV